MLMTVDGDTVEIRNLTKRFGRVLAVNDLSLTVPPGRVTGFLGPNGAGKTTTLRMILGLVRPSSGQVTIGGRHYADLSDPLRVVGAGLESTGFHPGRSARDHLRMQSIAAGLPTHRVDEVLSLVNLTDAARRHTKGFSLGMRQRLALATALLGDPRVLLMDEPANGLDPEGIAWLRNFLRHLAEQGRTVLVSSHILSEVQQTVDDVVIISQGRLIRHAPLAELSGTRTCLVRTPSPDRLAQALTAEGMPVDTSDNGRLRVTESDPARIGQVAFRSGIELHELTPERSDLEATYLGLVSGGSAPAPIGAPPGNAGPMTTGEQEVPQ
jgi:ABC-2 type transport system ATP-binding protein